MTMKYSPMPFNWKGGNLSDLCHSGKVGNWRNVVRALAAEHALGRLSPEALRYKMEVVGESCLNHRSFAAIREFMTQGWLKNIPSFWVIKTIRNGMDSMAANLVPWLSESDLTVRSRYNNSRHGNELSLISLAGVYGCAQTIDALIARGCKDEMGLSAFLLINRQSNPDAVIPALLRAGSSLARTPAEFRYAFSKRLAYSQGFMVSTPLEAAVGMGQLVNVLGLVKAGAQLMAPLSSPRDTPRTFNTTIGHYMLEHGEVFNDLHHFKNRHLPDDSPLWTSFRELLTRFAESHAWWATDDKGARPFDKFLEDPRYSRPENARIMKCMMDMECHAVASRFKVLPEGKPAPLRPRM